MKFIVRVALTGAVPVFLHLGYLFMNLGQLPNVHFMIEVIIRWFSMALLVQAAPFGPLKTYIAVLVLSANVVAFLHTMGMDAATLMRAFAVHAGAGLGLALMAWVSAKYLSSADT